MVSRAHRWCAVLQAPGDVVELDPVQIALAVRTARDVVAPLPPPRTAHIGAEAVAAAAAVDVVAVGRVVGVAGAEDAAVHAVKWWTNRAEQSWRKSKEGGVAYIRPLWALLGFILIVGFLLGGLINQCGRCHSDALTRRLETILVGAILDDTHLAIGIHIAIFALHLAGGQFRLDLERTIGALIAIGIGAILVVSV